MILTGLFAVVDGYRNSSQSLSDEDFFASVCLYPRMFTTLWVGSTVASSKWDVGRTVGVEDAEEGNATALLPEEQAPFSSATSTPIPIDQRLGIQFVCLLPGQFVLNPDLCGPGEAVDRGRVGFAAHVACQSRQDIVDRFGQNF